MEKPFKWVYDRASGVFVKGGPYDPDFDPATQGIERFTENPDPATERHDAGAESKKRPATAEEMAAAAVEKIDAAAVAAVADKAVLVAAEWARRELNTIRAAMSPALPPITRAEAVESMRTIWKAF